MPHLHLVTYGFSHLYYDEDHLGKDFSRFGFELTFRLRQDPADDDMPMWAINLSQNIALYVFKSGKWFEPGHYIPANGPIKASEPNAEASRGSSPPSLRNNTAVRSAACRDASRCAGSDSTRAASASST